MKTQSITSTSNTITIINCCIVAFLISSAISLISKVGVHDLMMNILDWQAM